MGSVFCPPLRKVRDWDIWWAEQIAHPTWLSKSTKRIDLREKFFAYQTIEQLQEYIVVNQTEMEVIMYHRALNWQAESFKVEDLLIIPSIELEISVKEIYERVVFE